jgi:hypothetical protein
MPISPWFVAGLLIVGAVLGAGGVFGSIAINGYTSIDAFRSPATPWGRSLLPSQRPLGTEAIGG